MAPFLQEIAIALEIFDQGSRDGVGHAETETFEVDGREEGTLCDEFGDVDGEFSGFICDGNFSDFVSQALEEAWSLEGLDQDPGRAGKSV